MLLRRCLSFNHCKLINLQFGISRQIGPNRSFFIDMPLLFPFLYHFSFFLSLSLFIFFVVFLTKRFCAFDSLEKWFSTFFDSQHTSFVIEHCGGTPSYNLPLNSCQVHKLAAPLELFTAPKGSTAPGLNTTGLELSKYFFSCENKLIIFLEIRFEDKKNCLAKFRYWIDN